MFKIIQKLTNKGWWDDPKAIWDPYNEVEEHPDIHPLPCGGGYLVWTADMKDFFDFDIVKTDIKPLGLEMDDEDEDKEELWWDEWMKWKEILRRSD